MRSSSACRRVSQPAWRSVGVGRILLTASGGPFRDYAAEALAAVTPEQACAHPNWGMGRKISVDSATMMNKGLEVIEACWLFGTGPERIEVVVHPPERHSLPGPVRRTARCWRNSATRTCAPPSPTPWPGRSVSTPGSPPRPVCGGPPRFRGAGPGALSLPGPGDCGAATGGTAPAVLNAANEVAVAAFLDGRIGFMAIAAVVEETLLRCRPSRSRARHRVSPGGRRPRPRGGGTSGQSPGHIGRHDQHQWISSSRRVLRRCPGHPDRRP